MMISKVVIGQAMKFSILFIFCLSFVACDKSQYTELDSYILSKSRDVRINIGEFVGDEAKIVCVVNHYQRNIESSLLSASIIKEKIRKKEILNNQSDSSWSLVVLYKDNAVREWVAGDDMFVIDETVVLGGVNKPVNDVLKRLKNEDCGPASTAYLVKTGVVNYGTNKPPVGYIEFKGM